MMLRLGLFLSLAATVSHLPVQERTRVNPFFSTSQGSGFAVECHNPDPGKPSTLTSEIKFDGVVQERRGSVGMGGLPSGATYLEVIMLHAERISSASSIRGFRRRDVTLDLKPGLHKIAFSCGASWSDEVAFYWDGLPQPTSGAVR